MIKSNHSSIRHEQKSVLGPRLYVLVVLVIMIEAITTFISLLTMTMNPTLIGPASIQKTSQAPSQDRFGAGVYFPT